MTKEVWNGKPNNYNFSVDVFYHLGIDSVYPEQALVPYERSRSPIASDCQSSKVGGEWNL